MSSATSLAFALIRIPRGQPRPSEDEFRQALAADRKQLHQPELNGTAEFTIAGPYPVVVDGADLDEWVVWEK
jgi:hypothetical protein